MSDFADLIVGEVVRAAGLGVCDVKIFSFVPRGGCICMELCHVGFDALLGYEIDLADANCFVDAGVWLAFEVDVLRRTGSKSRGSDAGRECKNCW